MPAYCMYLRKSRADLEAEAHGEGETLARHERALRDTAYRMDISIDAVYKEIVSGDTIADRPVMRRLIEEVSAGIWTGVLVVEVSRLARGDTNDQGTVAKAFKYSHTQIITPYKIYDPDNEFDEEYFEFGLFMSRREYSMIKRRLNAGRLSAVQEGKFCGSVPPYGYETVKLKGQKGYTLSPVPKEAEVIKTAFEMYASGKKTTSIVKYLNEIEAPTRKGGKWTEYTLAGMLRNPVYCGKIRWNSRKSIKRLEDGKVTISRPRAKEGIIITQGVHPAIISEEIFYKVQTMLNKNPSKNAMERSLKNPLAGILRCGACGKTMSRQGNSDKDNPMVICRNHYCPTAGDRLNAVEARLIESLGEWLEKYKVQSERRRMAFTCDILSLQKNLEAAEKASRQLESQLKKIFDFFELGIYTKEVFDRRREELERRIAESESQRQAIADSIQQEEIYRHSVNTIIPRIETVLNVYFTLSSIEEKNALLKSVLEKVDYQKEVPAASRGRNCSAGKFSLILYPRL